MASRGRGVEKFTAPALPVAHCGPQVVRAAGVSVPRRASASVPGGGVWCVWLGCAVGDTLRDTARLGVLRGGPGARSRSLLSDPEVVHRRCHT